MLARLARAVETFVGPSLGSAAATLTRAATIALAAAVAIALARAALAVAARRYGWERGWIVRCPQCGKLVADPRQAACPAGHRVRFPPGAARTADRRARRARAAALYSLALSLALAAAAFGGYAWLRIGAPVTPLSRACAALAFFFFLAALYAADFAVSPRPRGVGARLLHLGLALACLTPFLMLAFFSRAFEPTERRVEGVLWATPGGVYVSDGRSRKLGPPAGAVEAQIVEARLPDLDLAWQGLVGFRIGASRQPWRGPGGFLARRVDGSADWLRRHGVVVRRFAEEVPLPANVQIQIVRRSEGFEFEPATGR